MTTSGNSRLEHYVRTAKQNSEVDENKQLLIAILVASFFHFKNEWRFSHYEINFSIPFRYANSH